jgi:hypothetical protein
LLGTASFLGTVPAGPVRRGSSPRIAATAKTHVRTSKAIPSASSATAATPLACVETLTAVPVPVADAVAGIRL